MSQAAIKPARQTLRAERPVFDLLRFPIVGRFLRWKYARPAMQLPMLLAAALILYDGFWGPQLAPKNLAGVAPWVHWRGFVALAILVAGNLFCMACPFMLPRKLAKKFLPANRAWPARLRSKWLAAGLLVIFFWAYEGLNLWASPWLTAWVALAYFGVAFVVDGFFKGAAFCKYVCPIGQFHFVNSLASPLEIRVRQPSVCASCTTKDCIKGHYETPGLTRAGAPLANLPSRAGAPDNALAGTVLENEAGSAPVSAALPLMPARPMPSGTQGQAEKPHQRGRLAQNGCELWLFQERKVGNMDCTFCLDCVHACPHDNVGILARVPTSEIWRDDRRSGVGRFSDRPDLAALALVLVFAAFFNAFGMVTPVYPIEQQIATTLGTDQKAVVLLVMVAPALILLPLLLVGLAGVASRQLSGSNRSIVEVATRYSFALVPLGFGMWLAHYSFHFLAGALTIVPVVQNFLNDLGIPVLGNPNWALGPVVPTSMLVPIELMFLDVGLAATLLAAYRIARRENPVSGKAKVWLASAPWMVLAAALFIFGVWLMLQPMEMRGTLFSGA